MIESPNAPTRLPRGGPPQDPTEGLPAGPVSRSDKYDQENGQVLLSGLHALIRLPMDIRRRDLLEQRNAAVFISGYEGSPLAGYDLELQRNKTRLEQHQILFRPAVNEELAATAGQGSQLATNLPGRAQEGVTGIRYGKAPGFDRATNARARQLYGFRAV